MRVTSFHLYSQHSEQKAGGKIIHAPYIPIEHEISYHQPPPVVPTQPPLSAPATSRGIIGEVRVSQPLRSKPRYMDDRLRPHGTNGASAHASNADKRYYIDPGLTRRGMVGKLTQVTQASWITNVKVGGNRRDDSAGQGSGGDSLKMTSTSRPSSVSDEEGDDPRESEIKTEGEDDAEDSTQSLQDEYANLVSLLDNMS